MRDTRVIANMFELMVDDWYRTQQSTCCIIRTLSDSTSPMTSSMHPKERTIMQNIHILEIKLELMIDMALNSQLAVSFVL